MPTGPISDEDARRYSDEGYLFCRGLFSADEIAGVLRAAHDLGLNVPEQLAVIGVDDIPMAAYLEPPLTTIRQDFLQIGREAVRLLIHSLEEPTAPRQHLRLPAELIVRRSTGFPLA